MRNFFQTRPREQAARPSTSGNSGSQSAAAPLSQIRAEIEDGVTVSELSELEARALCAREGIAFFWPMRDPVRMG